MLDDAPPRMADSRHLGERRSSESGIAQSGVSSDLRRFTLGELGVYLGAVCVVVGAWVWWARTIPDYPTYRSEWYPLQRIQARLPRHLCLLTALFLTCPLVTATLAMLVSGRKSVLPAIGVGVFAAIIIGLVATYFFFAPA